MFHVEHFTQRQANLLPGRRMPAYKGCRYLLFQSLILCTVNWARPTLARKAMKRQARARMFARPLRGKRENTLSTRKKNITKQIAVNTSIKTFFMAVPPNNLAQWHTGQYANSVW